MGYITQEKDYWIHSNALSITLNALGNANRIQCSVSSGAVIMAFIEGDTTLGYNAAHNYKSWPLSASPTYFNSNTAKYVYVAIPKTAAIGTQAVVVFPSEKLDIDGKNTSGDQIGSTDYIYIYIHGHISEVETVEGKQQRRFISDPREHTGKLDTDQGRDEERQETEWYQWSTVMQTVTFLKRIVMAADSWFQNIRLGSDKHELTGVATGSTGEEYIDSEALVVTPSYVEANSLSKKHDDVAKGNIEFKKDITVDQNADIKGAANIGGDASVGGNLGVKGWLSAFGGIINTLKSTNFSGSGMTDTGFQLTHDDGNGNSQLVVDNIVARMKFIANILEVRKYVSMGGNYVFSPAASEIEQVDYLDGNGTLLGYETVKLPWLLRNAPTFLKRSIANIGIFSTKRTIKRVGTVDMSQVAKFRCWIKADDGTTKTVNTWQTGMLARCQTMDLQRSEGGTHTDSNVSGATQNRLYWREVVGTGQGRLTLDDGYDHSYIDLSNVTGHFLAGSDKPIVGDSVVCFGGITTALSNIIVIETIGDDAPAFKEYLGVGLQHIGHDNTSGELPRFSMSDADGKNTLKTRISPKTGNRFVAPEFIIEIDGQQYNMYTTLKADINGVEIRVGSLENGKNLLKGVLTGDGWKSHASSTYGSGSQVHNVGFDSDGYMEAETGDAYISREVTLSSNVEYTLSFYSKVTAQIPVTIFASGFPSVYVSYNIAASSASTRKKLTFTLPNGLGGSMVVSIGATTVKNPQIEKGSSATAFDAGDTEVSSSIKQTADSITARVATDEGYIAQLQIDTDGIETVVKNGKNLLPGVLTGTDWKGALYVVQESRYRFMDITVEDYWFIKGSLASYVASPIIAIESGKKYTLSFDAEGTSAISVYILVSNVQMITLTTSATSRRTVTFIASSTGNVRFLFGVEKIRYPQLEYGEEATAFDASTTETSSQIKQTADKIEAKVNDTGVDITNGLIKLIANKTTFQTTAGVPMIAVQMCNANGEVGTGAGYTIPSIVFYNGEIGASGVSVQWVLNYLGFIQATNAGVRFSFTELYNIYSFLEFDPDEEKYKHTGADSSEGIDSNEMARREFYSDQIVETVNLFNCGYYINQQGAKVYQPAQGKHYEMYNNIEDVRRYWLTNAVDDNFVPDDSLNNTASGYYYVPKHPEIENYYAGRWPGINDWQNWVPVVSNSRSGSGDTPIRQISAAKVFDLVYFEPWPTTGDVKDPMSASNPAGVMQVWENAFVVFYEGSTNGLDRTCIGLIGGNKDSLNNPTFATNPSIQDIIDEY